MSEEEKNRIVETGKNSFIFLIITTLVEIGFIAAYLIWNTKITMFLLVVGTLLWMFWILMFFLWYRMMIKKVKSKTKI
ncbi:hypothetical protein [Paucilactobacillus oligofermentans]|uniref:hypothetical protein n=1 Tax=Paucilactobacillus oligofermentans TaxID=293371 RepID=UPI00070F19E5|nr:hypothetical protein [Paucilactobacillus oligofermentans]